MATKKPIVLGKGRSETYRQLGSKTKGVVIGDKRKSTVRLGTRKPSRVRMGGRTKGRYYLSKDRGEIVLVDDFVEMPKRNTKEKANRLINEIIGNRTLNVKKAVLGNTPKQTAYIGSKRIKAKINVNSNSTKSKARQLQNEIISKMDKNSKRDEILEKATNISRSLEWHRNLISKLFG